MNLKIENVIGKTIPSFSRTVIAMHCLWILMKKEIVENHDWPFFFKT